jgi:hypothetical protein
LKENWSRKQFDLCIFVEKSKQSSFPLLGQTNPPKKNSYHLFSKVRPLFSKHRSIDWWIRRKTQKLIDSSSLAPSCFVIGCL